MGTKISITAAGDMLIQRPIPTNSDGFDKISNYIKKGDASFFNLETTIHRGGYPGNQFSGGSYLFADPKVLDVAKAYGFNMLSFANNHTFDFGYGGLEATLKHVNEAGFVHAGVGMNLDEAAAPVYLETPNGRVALIAMTSTTSFENNYAAMAGRQSRRLPGRPGVNLLRIREHITVTPEEFAVIHDVAERCGINVDNQIMRAEGFLPPMANNGIAEFGKKLNFVRGEETCYHTAVNQTDMDRLEKSIREAQAQADCILVSIHAHELAGTSKETPAEFLVEFAHMAIDMGAHAVLGHGPHLLRPLEIYKDRPIFYSIGDFVLHNESTPVAPEELYEKFGMTSDAPVCDIFCKRSKNYTVGLLSDNVMLEAVIPYFEMEDGKLTYMELFPIQLGIGLPRYRVGDPSFCANRGIIERFARMSEPYGTKIAVNEEGIGIVELP